MKPKNLISFVLIAFVVGSIAFLAFRESTSDASSPAADTAPQKNQIVATYFHGGVRCPTCRKLEAYAAEALKTGFPRALADGRLVWRTVDISQPENRHFVTDYQLQFQSLILVEMKDGRQQRWKNLDQIWQKVRDKREYLAYVQEEVGSFLEE